MIAIPNIMFTNNANNHDNDNNTTNDNTDNNPKCYYNNTNYNRHAVCIHHL